MGNERIELALKRPEQIACTVVGGRFKVSTVRLNSLANLFDGFMDAFGVGHGSTNEDALETMVFACNSSGHVDDYSDLDCARTTSVAEAKANHEATCSKWEQMAALPLRADFALPAGES